MSSNASDDNVALSAWVSFGRDDVERLADRERVEGLINFLYRNKHMTPFESSTFTFYIKTPLFVAREYMRHRTQSINEWSARYSQIEPEVYIPTADRPLVQTGKPGAYNFVEGTPEQYAVLVQSQRAAYEAAFKSYADMLAAGIAKEVARNVLPVGTYTYFYSTMNARNLMHLLSLRTAPDALYEIRQVADQMERYLEEKMPLTYKAYKEYT